MNIAAQKNSSLNGDWMLNRACIPRIVKINALTEDFGLPK
jgi:hypothetical protein